MTPVAVLFPSLLLLSGVMAQTTTPPPFCFGGMLPCGMNAVCDAATDMCVCNTGTTGTPRVACAASDRCLCTALADPNFKLFDPPTTPGTSIKVNLPCSVELTRGFAANGCFFERILAHPDPRTDGNRVFVKEVEVIATNPSVRFTVNNNGVQTVSGTMQAAVTSSNADGFNTGTLASCNNLKVSLNSTYGGAAVDLPSFQGAAGLCGNCDGTVENVGATSASQLSYFLQFVTEPAFQKGPHATVCGNIRNIVTFVCAPGSPGGDAKLSNAAAVCEPYIQDFGICVQKSNQGTAAAISTYDQVLEKFNQCINNVCNGNIATACGDIAALATSSGCAQPTAPTQCATP